MLSPAVRDELRKRSDRLSQKINDAKRHQTAISNELAAITRDIESDQEMREMITQRLDADMAEQRAARENDMLS